jgi:hypothetical protein
MKFVLSETRSLSRWQGFRGGCDLGTVECVSLPVDCHKNDEIIFAAVNSAFSRVSSRTIPRVTPSEIPQANNITTLVWLASFRLVGNKDFCNFCDFCNCYNFCNFYNFYNFL